MRNPVCYNHHMSSSPADTDAASTATASTTLPTDADGARRRLLEVSVGVQVFWLALPALGEQALNYSVGLFDTWLAGRVPPSPGKPAPRHRPSVCRRTSVGWRR